MRWVRESGVGVLGPAFPSPSEGERSVMAAREIQARMMDWTPGMLVQFWQPATEVKEPSSMARTVRPLPFW